MLNGIFAPGGIRALFQPILAVDGNDIRVHALECLSRGPKGTAIEEADALFGYVRSRRVEPDVDRHCIETAFAEASKLPQAMRMHVNVHASTITREGTLAEFIARAGCIHGIDLSRVVVEIVEFGPVSDGLRFRAGVQALRDTGVQIALDDVGVGHANYRIILETRPDYLKIDRYLISGIHRDGARQGVVRSVAQMAKDLGARVIAVGVEIGPEFATVCHLGVDLVQGFLLAPPREGSYFIDHGPGRLWAVEEVKVAS